MRLLSTEATVRTDDGELLQALDYVAPGAEQAGPPSARTTFAIARHEGGFELERDGGAPSVHAERTAVLAELFEQLHHAALEPFGDAVRVHAALGRCAGRGFLLVGSKGAGKTTLLLRLLFDGCEAHGDELVLLQGERALAFPRKFYLKQGTLEVVPELEPLASRLPSVRDAHGGAIRAFEPGDAGLPWRIEPVRPEVIVVLEPGFGGPSRIEDFPAFLTVERVLSQANLPAGRTAEAIREVCGLVDRCRNFHLRLGDPREASRELRERISEG